MVGIHSLNQVLGGENMKSNSVDDCMRPWLLEQNKTTTKNLRKRFEFPTRFDEFFLSLCEGLRTTY